MRRCSVARSRRAIEHGMGPCSRVSRRGQAGAKTGFDGRAAMETESPIPDALASSSTIPCPGPVQQTPEPPGQQPPVAGGGQRSQQGAPKVSDSDAQAQRDPSAMNSAASVPRMCASEAKRRMAVHITLRDSKWRGKSPARPFRFFLKWFAAAHLHVPSQSVLPIRQASALAVCR